jgi:O-antigen/teichoic acid export membrane protein
MVLTILSVAFNAVAVPRFARIPTASRQQVRARYHQSQLMLALACLVLLLLLALFPGPALALLGPHYTGLQREVVLMGVSSSIAMVGGAAYTLAAARGIVAPATITVPFSLLLQIALIVALPLGTVAGVLWVGLLSALGQWLVHLAYFEWRYRRTAVMKNS